MGIRVKNSFSEYCSRSILALWILCGLILASSNSFAADIPPATFHAKCWNWFRSFAGKTANRETKEFKADAKLWDEYFGANGKAPRLHGVHSGDINNPIFWESWKLLPEKLQQEILAVLDIPTSTENQFFKSLDKKLTAAGLENIRAYESFLSHITIGIS